MRASAPTRFRAFRIHRGERVLGKIDSLTLDDLSPGGIVIRARYAGLNYKDALATTEHGGVIRNFPRVGGSDVSGHVLSSDDPRWRPGDAVLAYAQGLGVDHDGGFSEYVRVRPDQLVALPPELDLLASASLGVAGFTAALAVHLLQDNGLRPGQGDVWVNGATGGVGSMAIAMLAASGYRVVAMSSKTEHSAWLRRQGAAEVLGSGDLAPSPGLLAKARGSAAIDSIGGAALDGLLRSMQPRGIVASVGNVGGNTLHTNVLPFILRGVRLIGVNLNAYRDLESLLWRRLATDLRPARLRENTRLIALDDLPEAIRQMLNAQTVGRTLVAFGEA